MFVSPLHWCRAHTHLYISSSRTCVLICPTTVICLCFTRVGPLVSCKRCVFGCWLTWRLLVAEQRSSATIPWRIDEKFAERETAATLWQVEFKLEDRDRLEPRLHRRGLHGQPRIIVKTKLGTQDVSRFTVDNIIQCLKDNGYGELPEELGQEALDNYFDMRQKQARKASWITFSVRKFSLLL